MIPSQYSPQNFGIILMYHRIADIECDPWGLAVTPDHFIQHLEVINKLFQPVKLGDLFKSERQINFSSNWVSLTFDDGYADNYHNASRILNQFNTPATFFLVSSYLNSIQGYWWDQLVEIMLKPSRLPPLSKTFLDMDISSTEWLQGISYTPEQYGQFKGWHWEDEDVTPRHHLFRKIYLSLRNQSEGQRKRIINKLKKELIQYSTSPSSKNTLISEVQMKELAQNSLFEIGAHSETHQALSSLSISCQEKEISKSKRNLEKKLSYPIIGFSYPYGIMTEESVSLVRKASYNYGCSVQSGFVTTNTNPYQLPRIPVGNWNGDKFSNEISKIIK